MRHSLSTSAHPKSLRVDNYRDKRAGSVISSVSEASVGDVVDNVPVKWIGQAPAVVLQVVVFLVAVLGPILDQNVLGYFITNPDLLETVTRWLTGLVALFTILLVARQNFVISPKVPQD